MKPSGARLDSPDSVDTFRLMIGCYPSVRRENCRRESEKSRPPSSSWNHLGGARLKKEVLGQCRSGYLEDYPDYITQGKTLEELFENLEDLYIDISSSKVPHIKKVDELVLS
jgi:hypothetical protein